jgi:hypothetical protein
MRKLVYIQSYAQAAQLGFKPFDSMISTVVDASKAPEVVIEATRPGWAWSVGDASKFTNRARRAFHDTDGYTSYAADSEALGVLLDALYTKRPRMFELTVKPVRYSVRKRSAKSKPNSQSYPSLGTSR